MNIVRHAHSIYRSIPELASSGWQAIKEKSRSFSFQLLFNCMGGIIIGRSISSIEKEGVSIRNLAFSVLGIGLAAGSLYCRLTEKRRQVRVEEGRQKVKNKFKDLTVSAYKAEHALGVKLKECAVHQRSIQSFMLLSAEILQGQAYPSREALGRIIQKGEQVQQDFLQLGEINENIIRLRKAITQRANKTLQLAQKLEPIKGFSKDRLKRFVDVKKTEMKRLIARTKKIHLRALAKMEKDRVWLAREVQKILMHTGHLLRNHHRLCRKEAHPALSR